MYQKEYTHPRTRTLAHTQLLIIQNTNTQTDHMDVAVL